MTQYNLKLTPNILVINNILLKHEFCASNNKGSFDHYSSEKVILDMPKATADLSQDSKENCGLYYNIRLSEEYKLDLDIDFEKFENGIVGLALKSYNKKNYLEISFRGFEQENIDSVIFNFSETVSQLEQTISNDSKKILQLE
jgi:hypothetical protein